jgi:hypothetical protein
MAKAVYTYSSSYSTPEKVMFRCGRGQAWRARQPGVGALSRASPTQPERRAVPCERFDPSWAPPAPPPSCPRQNNRLSSGASRRAQSTRHAAQPRAALRLRQPHSAGAAFHSHRGHGEVAGEVGGCSNNAVAQDVCETGWRGTCGVGAGAVQRGAGLERQDEGVPRCATRAAAARAPRPRSPTPAPPVLVGGVTVTCTLSSPSQPAATETARGASGGYAHIETSPAAAQARPAAQQERAPAPHKSSWLPALRLHGSAAVLKVAEGPWPFHAHT